MKMVEALNKLAQELECKKGATQEEIKLEGLDLAKEWLTELNTLIKGNVYQENPSLIGGAFWGQDLDQDLDIMPVWRNIQESMETLERKVAELLKIIDAKREELKQMPETAV